MSELNVVRWKVLSLQLSNNMMSLRENCIMVQIPEFVSEFRFIPNVAQSEILSNLHLLAHFQVLIAINSLFLIQI